MTAAGGARDGPHGGVHELGLEFADMTFEQHIRAINQSQAGDPWLRVHPVALAEGEPHGQGGGVPESEKR